MKNPALGIYSLVVLAVLTNTVAMALILGVTVVNEVKLINEIELKY